jgi:Tol biopolymer transport system component
VQLTTIGRFSGTPRWSPDGRWIAFDARVEDHAHTMSSMRKVEIFMRSRMVTPTM